MATPLSPSLGFYYDGYGRFSGNEISFVTDGSIVTETSTDTLTNKNGEQVKLELPSGIELPAKGFAVEDAGFQAPASDGSNVKIKIY